MTPSLASISVDLDEVHHYARIHGLAESELAEAAGAVYRLALPRIVEWAESLRLPLTFFAVGADALTPEGGPALRQLLEQGHEVANHSLDHRYDLTRLGTEAMRRQVVEGADAIEQATGVRPVGFRAPGYLMNDTLAHVLESAGLLYDSSVFPCPAYYTAKALVLARQRAFSRGSASLLDSPAVLRAPVAPYRLGKPYYRPGQGILELPIQVTPRLRLPFIGTALTLAGERGACWLTRQVCRLPFVNLELHGIDFLETNDRLQALARQQPDLRVPLSRKLEVLTEVVETLKHASLEFVRLDQAAGMPGRLGV